MLELTIYFNSWVGGGQTVDFLNLEFVLLILNWNTVLPPCALVATHKKHVILKMY